MDLLSYKGYSLSTVDVGNKLNEEDKKYFEDNYVKGKYKNQWNVTPMPKVKDIAKWKTERSSFASEKKERPSLPIASHPMGGFNGLAAGTRVMWLGHATCLIEMNGIYILTDPVFGNVAKVKKRQVPNPLSINELPALDVILISHGHYDHFDSVSLKAISKRFGKKLLYLIPAGCRNKVPKECSEVIEMNWWRKLKMAGAGFTFVPAQHWYRRSAGDVNQSVWGGWVIEGPRSIYFSGDTGYFSGFSLFEKVFGSFDLAILPIGAYEPRWLMSLQHMSPNQSLDAFANLKAKHFLGMHWGTYDLSDEPLDHGPRVLRELVEGRKLEKDCFHVLSHGGSIGFINDDVLERYSYDEVITDTLRIPGTIFEEASDDDMRKALTVFRLFSAKAGDVIINQGDPGDHLMYTLKGKVEVLRDGVSLVTYGPGKVIGEMALYTKEPRLATVRALTVAEFLLLNADDFKRLRCAENGVAWSLEKLIIGKLAKRLRDVNNDLKREIKNRMPGEMKTYQSLFDKIKSLLTSTPKQELINRLNATAVLRESCLLDEESDEVLSSLDTILRPVKLDAGFYLCRQGKKGEAMYFIVDGSVDIFVTLKGQHGSSKKYKVANLKSGSAVGMIALIDRQGRTADCVTSTETTVLTLDRPTWFRLFEQNDRVGSAMRIAVTKLICTQLVQCDMQLVTSIQSKMNKTRGSA